MILREVQLKPAEKSILLGCAKLKSYLKFRLLAKLVKSRKQTPSSTGMVEFSFSTCIQNGGDWKTIDSTKTCGTLQALYHFVRCPQCQAVERRESVLQQGLMGMFPVNYFIIVHISRKPRPRSLAILSTVIYCRSVGFRNNIGKRVAIFNFFG